MNVQPRHVLCVLHDGRTPVEAISRRYPGFQHDDEYSQSAHDPRMVDAFRASADRVKPSMTEADWAAVREHAAVSYVLSPPLTSANALEGSRTALSFVAGVLRAGALAIKGESSGIAHGREHWLRLEDQMQSSTESSLIGAWVRYPIASKSVAYSVGMHLLGARDVEVEYAGIPEQEAVEVIGGFLHFLLIDKPSNLDVGHTFGLRADARRFRLTQARCTRYASDDFFHNPYGYWRLAPVA